MQKVEIWTFTIELAFSLSAMLIESQKYYHGYLKECGPSDKKRGLIVITMAAAWWIFFLLFIERKWRKEPWHKQHNSFTWE